MVDPEASFLRRQVAIYTTIMVLISLGFTVALLACINFDPPSPWAYGAFTVFIGFVGAVTPWDPVGGFLVARQEVPTLLISSVATMLIGIAIGGIAWLVI